MTDQPKSSRRSVMKKGAVAAASLLTGFAFRPDAKEQADREQVLTLDPNAKAAGLKLRAAIDKFYETLPVDNRTIMEAMLSSPHRSLWIDISRIFMDHIPAGCSFDNGEAILRSAGLEITRARTRIPGASPDIFAGLPTTEAYLEKFSIWTFREMFVIATLVPVRADDFTEMGYLQAHLRKKDWKLLGEL